MTLRTFLTQGALALSALTFFTSCGQSSSRAAENAASAGVLQAVNRERVSRGLSKVTFDQGLKTLAADHSSFLVRNVYPQNQKPTREVAHANFKSRAERAEKKKYQVLSEVVMIGYAGDLSAVPERTLQGWLNSPNHRRAILNPRRRVMGIETRLPSDQRYFVVGLLSDGQVE